MFFNLIKTLIETPSRDTSLVGVELFFIRANRVRITSTTFIPDYVYELRCSQVRENSLQISKRVGYAQDRHASTTVWLVMTPVTCQGGPTSS